jgi:hypothetical protein
MMKKIFVLVTIICVLLAFGTAANANDKDALKKLQPLTQGEQDIYNKAKSNAKELHKFIQARTFIRALANMVGPELWNEKVIDFQPYIPEIKKLHKEIYKQELSAASIKEIQIYGCASATEQGRLMNIEINAFGEESFIKEHSH